MKSTNTTGAATQSQHPPAEGPGQLIQRITAQARAEAQKLTSEAEESVAGRKKTLQKRLEDIRTSAEQRIAAERKKLSQRADAAISLAEGRARLRQEERIYRSAIERTRHAFQEMRGKPGYEQLLAGWISEAATGVGAGEAVVSCPQADRTFLEEAVGIAATTLRNRGENVKLTIDVSRDENGQGIVLRDAARRRAFSNLVDDRLRRFDSDLRRIVFHAAIEPGESRGTE